MPKNSNPINSSQLVEYRRQTLDQISQSYQIFLQNLTGLNEKLGIYHPISVLTLFSRLLQCGYLSCEESLPELSKIPNKPGIKVILGQWSQRDVSIMLCDVLNAQKIVAHPLSGHLREYDINVDVRGGKIYTKEEIDRWAKRHLIGREERLEIVRAIDPFLEDGKIPYPITISCKGTGSPQEPENKNYTIAYVHQGGYNYYLDPSTQDFYSIANPELLYMACDAKTFRIAKNHPAPYGLVALRSMQKMISSNPQTISQDTGASLMIQTKKVIMDNQAELEQFYEENRDLYGEVAEMVLSLR